ncbi:MAG: hypothetical protein ABIP51_05550 [Bacteroidia bacterium]
MKIEKKFICYKLRAAYNVAVELNGLRGFLHDYGISTQGLTFEEIKEAALTLYKLAEGNEEITVSTEIRKTI